MKKINKSNNMIPKMAELTAKATYILLCGMLLCALLFAAIPELASDRIDAIYYCKAFNDGAQRLLILGTVATLYHFK